MLLYKASLTAFDSDIYYSALYVAEYWEFEKGTKEFRTSDRMQAVQWLIERVLAEDLKQDPRYKGDNLT